MRIIRSQNRVLQMGTVFWWPLGFFGGLSFFAFGVGYSAMKLARSDPAVSADSIFK